MYRMNLQNYFTVNMKLNEYWRMEYFDIEDLFIKMFSYGKY